jgi:hypothetical protein
MSALFAMSEGNSEDQNLLSAALVLGDRLSLTGFTLWISKVP